jgi:hypothetical protein
LRTKRTLAGLFMLEIRWALRFFTSSSKYDKEDLRSEYCI